MMAAKKAIKKDKFPGLTNWTVVHDLVAALEAARPHVPMGATSEQVKQALKGVAEAHKLASRYAGVIRDAQVHYRFDDDVTIDFPPLVSESEGGADDEVTGLWISAALYFPLNEDD